LPRPFFQATAEQVVIVSEAIASLGAAAAGQVGEFTDLPEETAQSALRLAVDLGLLSFDGASFSQASPLCRLLRTPHDKEKSAVLRIVLEQYDPFIVFREEYEATKNATESAHRTKTKLSLEAHRENIKETLLGLATYTGAMSASRAGEYERDTRGVTLLLDELAAGSREVGEATLTIRSQLGSAAEIVDQVQVIEPFVAGLRHAAAGNGREAVLQAGIAVENFLVERASFHTVSIAGANGINAKMDKLCAASKYSKKLLNVGKYVGHVRNAADHGADEEIGAPWAISPESGRNYVFVAAALVRAMVATDDGSYMI
jgi:hypothetical protein